MITEDKLLVPKLTLIQGGKSLFSKQNSYREQEKRKQRLRRPNALNPNLIPIWHHLVCCPESKDWQQIDKEVLRRLAVHIHIYLAAKLDAARCDIKTTDGAREQKANRTIMNEQSKFVERLRGELGFAPYDDTMDGIDREFGYLSQ